MQTLPVSLWSPVATPLDVKTKKQHRGQAGSRRPVANVSGADAGQLQQAVRLHQQGQLEAAEALYRAILHTDPQYAGALQLLGVIAGQRGHAEQAIELIDQSLAIEPANAPAWSNRGNALLELKRYTEALESYDRALALNPKYAEALHNRGLALHNLNRTEEALASYDRALELRPDYPQALNHRGIVLAKTGRKPEALAAFRRAVALQPADPEFHANLGKVLIDLRQLESAEKSLRQSLQIGKTAAAFEGLGRALYQLGRPEEAIDLYRQWLTFEPENPIAQHLAAVSGTAIPERASDSYVRNVFDAFADDFDTTLRGIAYRAPELLTAQIRATLGTEVAPMRVLDAGCGTGLAAPLLRPLASQLVGVDLSQGMLAKAQERQLYDELVVAELCAFMHSRLAAFDLIFLTDTLIYFGALEEVFRTAHAALVPGGMLAFSVESRAEPGPDYQLELHGRYSHRPDYVRQLLAASGYALQSLETIVIRRELNADVAGIAVVARRQS
jgi:predicted TPR repeat methyltransferase